MLIPFAYDEGLSLLVNLMLQRLAHKLRLLLLVSVLQRNQSA